MLCVGGNLPAMHRQTRQGVMTGTSEGQPRRGFQIPGELSMFIGCLLFLPPLLGAASQPPLQPPQPLLKFHQALWQLHPALLTVLSHHFWHPSLSLPALCSINPPPSQLRPSVPHLLLTIRSHLSHHPSQCLPALCNINSPYDSRIQVLLTLDHCPLTPHSPPLTAPTHPAASTTPMTAAPALLWT